MNVTYYREGLTSNEKRTLARKDWRDAVVDTLQWFKDTGEQMVQEGHLIPMFAFSSKVIKALQGDILFSPADKPLNRTVAELKPYLIEHYGIFRLQWIVEYSEFVFDVVVPTGQYRSLWTTYRTLLREPPKDTTLPQGTNWYWVVRRHYRQFDKVYVAEKVRDYFKRHPDAMLSFYFLRTPPQSYYQEIRDEIQPHEVRDYLMKHKASLHLDKIIEEDERSDKPRFVEDYEEQVELLQQQPISHKGV